MKKLYCFLFVLLFTMSCSKEVEKLETVDDIVIPDTEYNKMTHELALAVNHAMQESEDFRIELKNEALRMFDGDYDILLSNIVSKKIRPTQSAITKGFSENNFTIGDLLNSSLHSTSKDLTKSGEVKTKVGDMIEMCPKLQMSIPVNIDKWNTRDVLPIAVVPDNFDEKFTKSIVGYDSRGERILVDAINEPKDDAYVVIGLNERMDFMSESVILDASIPTPTNLTGSQTESGLQLKWQIANRRNVFGYKVYRMGADEFQYSLIGTIGNPYVRTFNDVNVKPHKIYSYYVVAYKDDYNVSDLSNIISIKAPAFPEPVADFEALVDSKTCVELRWKNNNTQYNKYTNLYKRKVGGTDDYSLLRTFAANESSYLDRSVIGGEKIVYRIAHQTDLGESSYEYDVVHVPYRNIHFPSAVNVKQIKISSKANLKAIESWIYGKPEFFLTVANISSPDEKPNIIVDKMILEFKKRSTSSQIFSHKKLLDWQPGFWHDMLSFNLVEYDNTIINGSAKISMGVGYNKKVLNNTSLNADAKVDLEINFSNSIKNCGTAWLNYFDNPEKWLYFQNYGVSMLVSEKN